MAKKTIKKPTRKAGTKRTKKTASKKKEKKVYANVAQSFIDPRAKTLSKQIKKADTGNGVWFNFRRKGNIVCGKVESIIQLQRKERSKNTHF